MARKRHSIRKPNTTAAKTPAAHAVGATAGPVTLAQAKALAHAKRPRPKGAKAALADAAPDAIGVVRKKAALWRPVTSSRSDSTLRWLWCAPATKT